MAKTKKTRRKRTAPAEPRRKRTAPAEPPPPPPAARPLLTNAAIFAGVGVVVGAVAGWYLRDERAADPPPVAAAADGATDAGTSCDTWKKAVCDGVGAASGECKQATSASSIMPASACQAALAEVATTLEELKKGRAICDELAEKLCHDVGQNSPTTCDMIKKRMAGMPAPICKERRENYPKLKNQLQQLANPAMRRPGGRRPAPAGHGHDHGPGDGHGHGDGNKQGDGHGHDDGHGHPH